MILYFYICKDEVRENSYLCHQYSQKRSVMKRFLLLIALVVAAISVQAADITVITTALKTGNATNLQTCMDKSVDMALADKSKICNAQEAVSMLNGFFSSNKPSAFSLLHHADKKDSGFLVAKLTAGNKSYRVNVTYKVEGDEVVIQSIRIE